MALSSRNHCKRVFDGRRSPLPKSNFMIFTVSAGKEAFREEEIVTAKRRKMKSLLDIDSNPSPLANSSATAAGYAAKKVVNRCGFFEEASEEGKGRKRSRWDALLDAAAISLIREYEGNLEREDLEFRAENRNRDPRKSASGGAFVNSWISRDLQSGNGVAYGYDVELVTPAFTSPLPPPLPVIRSKRGRIVELPNRYKDSILGTAEEEIRRFGKMPAGVDDVGRRSRPLHGN